MRARLLPLLTALVFTVGCNGDVKAFLGVWKLTETRTFTYAGRTRSESFTSTVEITEGVSSDIVITDSRGCAFPAMVKGKVATLSDTICTETETFDGDSGQVTLHLTEGTATIISSAIQLDYQGTLNATSKGLPYVVGLESTGQMESHGQ